MKVSHGPQDAEDVLCSVSRSQNPPSLDTAALQLDCRAADLLASQWWKGGLFLEATIQQFNSDSNLLHLQQAFVKIWAFLKCGKEGLFF